MNEATEGEFRTGSACRSHGPRDSNPLMTIDGSIVMETSEPQAHLHVLVAHESVFVRTGMGKALEAQGHNVTVSDPRSEPWSSVKELDVVVICLNELLARPSIDGPAVVIVLPEEKPSEYVKAFKAGAAGVLCLTEPSQRLIRIVECVSDNQTTIPIEIIRAFATHYQPDPKPVELSTAQRSVLQSLAAGGRLANIAEAISYSTREVSRIVASLLEVFEVGSREELLVSATRHRIV